MSLGEEDTSCTTRKRRQTAIGWSQTRRYVGALGLDLGVMTWLYRTTWVEEDDHDRRRFTKSGWRAASRPASVGTVKAALGGVYGLSLGGQQSSRVLVFDIDRHSDDEVFGAARDVCLPVPQHDLGGVISDFDVWEKQERRSRRARKRDSRQTHREEIAGRARPVLDALRAAHPDVTFLPFATPRGVHLVVLLDELRSPAELQHAGRAMLARAGLAACEVFPRPEAGGGRLCRLPLTGSSRLLAVDLVAPRHRRRADDLAALLDAPRASAATLCNATLCGSMPGTGDATSDGPMPAAPCDATQRPAMTPRAGTRARRPRIAATGDDALRSELAEHLEGDDFERALLDAYATGMPDDSSFDVARKLAFLTVAAAGLAMAEAERVGRAWIDLPHHRASHAATRAGRAQWIACYRSCCRHQMRGIESGRIAPGRLARTRLWQMLRDLLGGRVPRLRPVVAPIMRERLSQVRRAAARRRWDSRPDAA